MIVSPIKKSGEVEQALNFGNESVNPTVNILERCQNGSFMPAVLACEKGLFTVDEIQDPASGLTFLHYAAFYGSVKPLRYIMSKFKTQDSLQKSLLKKDTIEGQENCENSPLHSSIYGGELPAVKILLKFEQFIDPDLAKEIDLDSVKSKMLSSRNRMLNTPLMLAICEEKIRMFIYLLYSHENFFLSEGLKCMDIDGNSLLHLAAKCSPKKSLHFAKVLLNFNSGAYRKMMNMRNNEACTPLFVAVQNRNAEMVKFMMDSNAMYMPDITIKNKNGETVREYIERNL